MAGSGGAAWAISVLRRQDAPLRDSAAISGVSTDDNAGLGADDAALSASARWFQDAERYSRRNAIVELRARMVREVLGDVKDLRILDLGCGDGSLSLQFAGVARELALVDFSAPMLEAARAKVPPETDRISFHPVDLTAGVASDIPPADIVMCIGVLAHVSDPEALVGTAARLVAPGGRLLLQITDAGHRTGELVLRFDNLFRSVRQYRLTRTTLHGVQQWAGEHGLALSRSETHAPAVSGFRILPAPVQRRMLSAIERSRWAEPLRTETLLLFSAETEEAT